ncbi:winged helix-turn-helix domain-containing protein [Candidatus Pelagibacter sp. HIMB1709]|uniref:winged helix-turn-helix domain-containing protein n=1 Tax=Candidatus Pelagibacter sp. HIMB1709 TaxID=3413367 RepID=UPI003F87AA16
MSSKNLIVYQLSPLFQILKEIDLELNLNVIEIKDEKNLSIKIKNLTNYLVLTTKQISNIQNQHILNTYPVKLFRLIEKINILFIKNQFNNQSKIKINNYILNLNSREIFNEKNKLKLTEKEVNIISYLHQKQTPVSIDELELNVWNYQKQIETHTVETHIYRLRKKILKIFKDQNFIINNKNGYQIQ